MSAAKLRSTEELTEALLSHVGALCSALVCYSGGVDSALVLAAAHRALGPRAIGLTAVSPSLAGSELDDARRVAAALGADHRVVQSDELSDPGYQQNGPDRCFYCKSELYRIAEAKARDWGLAAILNGTNLDDLGDHRPGLDAARRAGVLSPFVELGMNKADVRRVAEALGVSVWDKPAAACLSSRIPYGTGVTPLRLERIAALEASLRELGFRRVRVRYHLLDPSEAQTRASSASEKAMARIELDAGELERAARPELREAIVQAGKRHGFVFVTLDLGGYRMGSHNELLAPEDRRGPTLRILG